MQIAFAHDTAHTIDIQCRHLFLRTPVCQIHNADPNDHDPLHFPADHQPPEIRGLQAARDDQVQDWTDRWIALTEEALRLQLWLELTGDIEEALSCLRVAIPDADHTEHADSR